MNKNGVLVIAAVCVGLLAAFISCESNTSPGIEESFDVIKDVSAISNAQNVSMNLQDNSTREAHFTVELSNIEPNNLINNGIKEAWCIDWEEPAIKGPQDGVKLYSTKGREGWQELNYFLSIKNKLKRQDPALTWKEIQVVVWSLVQFKPFDVDQMGTYKNLDQRFFKDGAYQFDVQKVKNIISTVKNDLSPNSKNKSLKEVSSYEVFAVIVENDGQTVIVEGEETFWAFGTDYCFRSDDGQQWGWVYGFDAGSEHNSETTPLVAGAGLSNCPDETVEETGGTIVGDVTITKSGDELTITFVAIGDIVFDVVHIDVGCNLDELKERIINKGENAAPGRFPIAYSDDEDGEYFTEVTFTVSISDNDLDDCINSDRLYFAIHGVSATHIE